MSELNEKHRLIITKAAAAVRDRGHDGDARLADSLHGILASFGKVDAARRTPSPAEGGQKLSSPVHAKEKKQSEQSAAPQAHAEPVAHVVDIDRNHNESIISAALEPGTALYATPVPAAPSAEREAARYRFLRNPDVDVALVLDKRTGYVPQDEQFPGIGGYHTYEYRAGEELDEAIDAAMSRDAGSGGGK